MLFDIPRFSFDARQATHRMLYVALGGPAAMFTLHLGLIYL
ncbi:hypothetical protein [Desulfohalovibrio reitneri]|nr:hypothetical protein [Desulfohalovibrio reitneri]